MEEATADAQIDSAEITRLLTCSELRKNLILTLNDGSASLAELRERVDVSSTAAIHALRELEKSALTYQDDKRHYALTNVGTILAHKLEELIKTANVLTEHSTFWLKHDLSGIPVVCLENISCLEDSRLLASTPTDLFKVFSTSVTLLENSREIRGVLPILTPELIQVFNRIVDNGVPTELVVTRQVLDKILESFPRGLLPGGVEANLTLFVIDQNPKVVLTVTDYFTAITLYRFDESYDYSEELVCYNADGMKWGRVLFDYYLATSERFAMEGWQVGHR